MQKRTFLTDNKPVSIDLPVTIRGLIIINSTDVDCVVTADNGDTFPCPAKVISTWSVPTTSRVVAKLAGTPTSGNCNVIVTDAETLNSTSQLATLSGGSTLKFQKNGVLVAAEATLDFEDSALVQWVVTDDLPNLRVKVSATPVQRAITGQCAAAGGVIGGNGFTNTRTGVGRYTITFTTPFAITPTAVASLLAVTGNEVITVNMSGGGNSFQVNIQDGAGAPADRNFNFIAMQTL